MNSVLVGMFDSQTAASQAKAKLMSAGFSANAVTMTGGSESTSSTPASTASTSSDEQEGPIGRFFDRLFGGGSQGDDELDRANYTNTYKEAFKRGSYGVSVTTTSETEMDKAEQVLNECGAVDIDEQANSWRKEGWTGAALGGTSAISGATTNLEAGATRKLQEVEEELKVGKRAVAKGGVRIFSRMTEVPVSETVVCAKNTPT